MDRERESGIKSRQDGEREREVKTGQDGEREEREREGERETEVIHNFFDHVFRVDLSVGWPRGMLFPRNRKLGCLYNSQFPPPLERLWRLFMQQLHSASSPCDDRPWLIPLIKSCSSESQLRQLHARILITAANRDAAVTAAFLSTAAALPETLPYLVLVFQTIPKRFTPHYNAVIRSFSRSSSPEKSFFLFRDMRRNRVKADPVSFTFVLKALTELRHHFIGEQLHGEIVRSGHLSDALLLTSLMDFYASCGNILHVELLFGEMPQRDLVAWNVLVSCYTQNGRSKDAISLFDLMQEKKYMMEPDRVTCLILLQACSNLGALQFGERVHHYIEDRGYGGVSNLRNSLIAMYSKCGAAEKALSVFRDTPDKTVVSWSAIISGLAMNGRGREALEVFSQMRKAGIAPDEQTLTGVLSACSHAGMIREGLRLFCSISSDFGLTPNLHHYSCAVDLMGRAGMLQQAYDLILNSKEIKPDAKIWRTLLGASRIHRRIEIAELASQHLTEIEAREAGDCILLLNIYASKGDWEKVAEIRRQMREKKIQTQPGCSTIEISRRVHEFVADDIKHARKIEIYEMLEEMGKRVRMAGYVARVEAEMHFGGVQEKTAALSFHSEKLAMAFGIMCTLPGETIRVAKNLRTCEDCHEFAKAVSAVYNRELIVRDRSRFHHFRVGRCSCNGYW